MSCMGVCHPDVWAHVWDGSQRWAAKPEGGRQHKLGNPNQSQPAVDGTTPAPRLTFSRCQSALPAVPAFAGVPSRAGKSVRAVPVGSTLRIPGRVARIGRRPGRWIAVRTRYGHTRRREENLGHTRIVLAKSGPCCRSLRVLLADAARIAIGVDLAGASHGCRHGEHGHDKCGEEEAHRHSQAVVRHTPMMPER